MNDAALNAFAAEIAGRVDESVHSEEESPYHEREFTRIVIEELSEDGALENPIALWQEGHFGKVDYKISGYAIPDDDERLTLITTVYVGERIPQALTSSAIMDACHKALKFYDSSCRELYKQIEPANTDASDLARRIYEGRGKIGMLRVILLSDGLTGLQSIDLKKAFDGTRVVVDLFGIERLHRILGRGLTRDDIFVDIEKDYGGAIPCLQASSAGSDYKAYLSVLPGSLLADIYEKYGTRLLELNVRAFLGLRGKNTVNANLRRTIRELPQRFLAYNNGIVATADSIDVVDNGKGELRIRALRGLQIVNGGQTTASLHRALSQDNAKLDEVAVPAKLICVSNGNLDEMVSAVSRSANSQNTVQPADFSSNEPFHVAVENLANNVWLPGAVGRWFYERARGSYGAAELASSSKVAQSKKFARETPKERRFSKTDLAKYLNAWNGLPNLVSYGNQKNFQYFMQSMKDNKIDGMELDQQWFRALIAKAILFRSVQSIVKQQKFPAYQANIAAHTVACISWKNDSKIDFELIWTKQAISSELRKLVVVWSKEIDRLLRKTAGSRMPSEWAKKAECWTEIRDADLSRPEADIPEFSGKDFDLESELKKLASKSVADHSEAENDGGEFDREKLILNIRDLFSRGETKDRNSIIVELSRSLGYRRTGSRIKEELDNVIRTAVRRGILENRGNGLALCATGIGEYEREFLKDQFIAALPGRSWATREEGTRLFARWLGFRRVGSNIEETAKSLISGLIRDGKIESDGSQIRRR